MSKAKVKNEMVRVLRFGEGVKCHFDGPVGFDDFLEACGKGSTRAVSRGFNQKAAHSYYNIMNYLVTVCVCRSSQTIVEVGRKSIDEGELASYMLLS